MEGLQNGCKTRDKIIQKKKKLATNEECLFIVLFQYCVTSGVLYEDGTNTGQHIVPTSSQYIEFHLNLKAAHTQSTHRKIRPLYLLFLQPFCVSHFPSGSVEIKDSNRRLKTQGLKS